MSEELNTPWTDRQKFGFEYTQYTTDLNKKMSLNRTGGNWTISFEGKSMDPPEVEMLKRVGGMVVYYDADLFNISHDGGDGKKRLDLNEITPSGWQLKSFRLTSGDFMPPEVHAKANDDVALDPGRKEIVIGNLVGSTHDSETLGKIILWHVLVARFLSEVGEPANEEAVIGMRKAVGDRREAVLNALSGESDEDPKEVATRPFLETKEQDRF